MTSGHFNSSFLLQCDAKHHGYNKNVHYRWSHQEGSRMSWSYFIFKCMETRINLIDIKIVTLPFERFEERHLSLDLWHPCGNKLYILIFATWCHLHTFTSTISQHLCTASSIHSTVVWDWHSSWFTDAFWMCS